MNQIWAELRKVCQILCRSGTKTVVLIKSCASFWKPSENACRGILVRQGRPPPSPERIPLPHIAPQETSAGLSSPWREGGDVRPELWGLLGQASQAGRSASWCIKRPKPLFPLLFRSSGLPGTDPLSDQFPVNFRAQKWSGNTWV